MYKDQLQVTIDDINKRMKGYHSSLEPTNDEVTIAWLLTVIDELEKKVEHLDQFNTFMLHGNPTGMYKPKTCPSCGAEGEDLTIRFTTENGWECSDCWSK
jgi:hypothetical protein